MFKKALSIVLITTLILTALVIAPITAQAHPAQTTQTGADSPVQLGADNSLGEMFSTAVNREQNDGANGITDVSVNGTNATVVLNNEEACTVIVGIYDESDDHLIATAIQRSIPANAESVTLNFSTALPQYYYLRAFILDSACCPLAKQYESSRYTQAYAEFLEKTTDDFPAARVMNLDNDTTDNFAVLDDSVTKVTTSASANTPAKTSDSTYTFSNIDDTLRSLKQGDIFTFELNGNPEVVKIGAITVSDNTATITSTKAEMEEVFDYVKIDTTSEQQSQIASTGSDFEAEYSLKKEFPLSENEEALSYGVSGSVEIGVTVWVKLHFAAGIREVDLVLDYGGEADAALSLKLSHSITLGVIPVPLPVVGLVFKIKAELELEAEAKLEIDLPFTGTLGFHYSNKSGFTNLSHKPELDPEITCEGKVYAGVKLTPAMDAFTVADAGISAEVGIEAVGTPAPTVTDYKESDHLCDWCIEGKTNLVFKAEAELEFGATLIGLTHKMTFPLGEYSKKLFNFHISSKNGFGIGECKNRKKPIEYSRPELQSNSNQTVSCSIQVLSETTENITVADGYDIGVTLHVKLTINATGSGRCFLSGIDREKFYCIDRFIQSHCDKPRYCSNFVIDKIEFNISGFSSVEYPYVSLVYRRPRSSFDFLNWNYDTLNIDDACECIIMPADDVTPLVCMPSNTYNATSYAKLPDSVKYIISDPSLVLFRNNFLSRDENEVHVYGETDYCNYHGKGITISDERTHKYAVTIPSGLEWNEVVTWKGMKNVIVPDTLRYTKTASFPDAESAILFSEGDNVFNGSTKLKQVTIGSAVTKIGKHTFENTGLERITIPGTVKSIDESAFANCPNLREVIIGNGVREISADAFANCPNLVRVEIPASVGILDETAFSGCSNVILDYDGTVEQWNNIIADYSCDYTDNTVSITKMGDLPDYSCLYRNCTIYCYPNEDGETSPAPTGGNPQSAAQTAPLGKGAYALTGASSNTLSGKYTGAEYLIAVENAQNGLLNGDITALKQVTADDSGCIDISGINCPDGQYLNTYGACRHPSAHAQTVDGKTQCACDICGASVKPIITGESSAYIDIEDRLLGDADCDKNVTILDATAVQRKLAGFIPTRFHAGAADADSDGTLTILDATAIQRYLAGYDVDLYGIKKPFYVPPTEPPTDPPTEPPTDPPTEPPTDPPTEEPTEPETDPETEEPTDAPTEAPTQEPTELVHPHGDITFDPGEAGEGDPVWYAWVWGATSSGKWIAGTVSGNGIVFPEAAEYDYIVVVKMKNGTTNPDWSDDVCLNQSVNISITGNHLTFTGWSESTSWGDNMFTAAFQ